MIPGSVYIKVYLDNSAFDEASKMKKLSKSDKRTTKKKIWTWKKNLMQNKNRKRNTKDQSIEIYR